MKCITPEISWHNKDPVLSIDIQQKNPTGPKDYYRLASGGTDSHVLIWYLKEDEIGHVNLELAADLTRHQRAVNCVRWSPSGEFLASADDEGAILIWKLKSESEPLNILEDTNDQDKEIWLTFKILRGHIEDVYDLSWSPNSLNLISGSVDNTAIIWDVIKGKSLTILSDHKSFVQGVSWDPKNQYLATLCSDRCMRVFDLVTKKVVSRSKKSTLPVPNDSPIKDKILHLYHDDTLQTFYRRISFSPDGEILIAPSGVVSIEGQTTFHSTYLYTRYDLKKPSVILPSPDQYTVAVRFCPILFELHSHDESNPPLINLPYRMIFAVATKSSVYLYDTQQRMPCGMISNIHYTRLTDLTWSDGGKLLLVSSTDGFCTVITFAEHELGSEYKKPEEKSLELNSDNKNGNEANGAEGKLTNSDVSKKCPTILTEPLNGNHQSVEAETKKIPMQTIQTLDANKSGVEKIIKIDIPETIISSEEKFRSPELKINKPATPIQIRREPLKTPKSVAKELKYSDSPKSIKNDQNLSVDKLEKKIESICLPKVMAKITPVKTSQNTPKTPRSNGQKKPTPIAVRRKPRAIIVSNVERETTFDEALDAWPIDQRQPSGIQSPSKTIKMSPPIPSAISGNDTEHMVLDNSTENIRLVYEDDSQIESEDQDMPMVDDLVKVNNNLTPNSKTPRRIELRTVSTPKSKKKL